MNGKKSPVAGIKIKNLVKKYGTFNAVDDMSLNVNKQVFEIWEKYRKSYIEDPPGEYDYKGKSLLLKKDEGKDPLQDLIPITYNKNEYKKSKKS